MHGQSLPNDRAHVRTEQRNDASMHMDSMSTQACVRLFTDDHIRVHLAVKDAADAIAAFIDDLTIRMADGGRLIYLGAGTSGRLGVLDAAECPPTFQSSPEQVIGIIAGGDASLRRSSEAREDDPRGAQPGLDQLEVAARDTVLGIAAGGTTPYVLGGIEHAHERGALTGLLTCAVPALVREEVCDHFIVLDTGPELLTGSTRLKAGSATKLALNIITTTAFIKLGKVYSNLMVDLRATNDKLRDRAIRILMELCPGLTRSEAAARLIQAGDQLKVAIVMQRLEVNRIEAVHLLAVNDGHLRRVLEASDRSPAH